MCVCTCVGVGVGVCVCMCMRVSGGYLGLSGGNIGLMYVYACVRVCACDDCVGTYKHTYIYSRVCICTRTFLCLYILEA